MAYDVTHVNDDSKNEKAHKEGAENESVTNEVTSVCDDEKENKILGSRNQELVEEQKEEKRSHVCHQCGKAFKNYETLRTHSQSHSPKFYLCSLCVCQGHQRSYFLIPMDLFTTDIANFSNVVSFSSLFTRLVLFSNLPPLQTDVVIPIFFLLSLFNLKQKHHLNPLVGKIGQNLDLDQTCELL